MTTRILSRRTPVSDQRPDGPGALARAAVGTAGVVAGVVTAASALVGVAYAVGGDDAISDNWVGFIGGVALLGGLSTSLVAFVLAVLARIGQDRWRLLWLPLLLFPGLLALVVLAEAFWLE